MRKVSIFTLIYVGLLLVVKVEAGEVKPNIVDEKTSKILVTSKVVEALGRIGNSGARDVLVEALKSKDFFIKAYAAEALGRIQDKESIPLLKKLIDDKNYLVRISVAVALVKLGEKEAEELVFSFLKDEDPTVRAVAASNVGELGEKFLQALTELLSTEKEYLVWVNVIEEFGESKFNPALPYIRKAMEDENAEVRRAACYAIGKIRDKESIPQLLQRLDDESPLVRAAAQIALAKLGDRSRIEVFRKGMYAEESILVASSYLALAYLGEMDILPILLEKIQAPESPTIIRTKAVQALMLLKPRMLKLVEDTFKQGENLQNISLLKSLQFSYQIDGSSLALVFTQALKDSKSPLYHDAPLVLKELKERVALPGLREALLADDPDLAASAAYVLGALADKDATSALIKVFKKHGI
jgi:HEAT repeat protein